MAETDIEWTHTILPVGFRMPNGTILTEPLVIKGFTMNAWWGCVEVSPGCAHCYAKAWDKRMGGANWGLHGPRRMMSEAHMRLPFKWNKDAKKMGVPAFVFASSMSDLLEDHPAVGGARKRMFEIMEATPWLVWLILTKRIENAEGMVPAHWMEGRWPKNVWIGCTVENQAMADRRVPILLRFSDLAPRTFLSVEPLVGPLDLSPWVTPRSFGDLIALDKYDHDAADAAKEIFRPVKRVADIYNDGVMREYESLEPAKVSWVIVGGESGDNIAGVRPMHPEWVRKIVGACKMGDVPVFFKQWGRYLPVAVPWLNENGKPYKHIIMDHAGNVRPATWNEAMATVGNEWAFADVGKKIAANYFDGEQVKGRPEPLEVVE